MQVLFVGLTLVHVAPLLNLTSGFFLYVLICEVDLPGFFFLHTESFVVSWIEECRQLSLVYLESAAQLIAWRRDRQRKHTVISLERIRKLKHCESDPRWNCFQSNTEETFGRMGGAIIMGFPGRVDTTLN